MEIKVYQTSLVKNTILKRPLQNLGLFETVDNKHDDIKVNNNIGSTSTLTWIKKITAVNSVATRRLTINEEHDGLG